MVIVDSGDSVVLTVSCGCGHRFEMTAHYMDGMGAIARACYVERMRRSARVSVTRHCRLGASTLN